MESDCSSSSGTINVQNDNIGAIEVKLDNDVSFNEGTITLYFIEQEIVEQENDKTEGYEKKTMVLSNF